MRAIPAGWKHLQRFLRPPWLEGDALRQIGGLPHDAFDVLARTMTRLCENPYDRLFSLAASRGRLHDASVVDNVREPTDSWTSGLVHSEPGATHDGDAASDDQSIESRGEEHMRQAENVDAEAAGQPSEGAGDRRGAHEDG